MQTVYNALDFSYRPSVGKKSVEKSKMGDNVPVAMGFSGDQDIFWMYKKQNRHFYVEYILLTIPANFAFARERFNNDLKSISSLMLTTVQRRVVLDFHSVVDDVVRASRNVTNICRICMQPVLSFVLFWLLRTKFKVLDEIKHLFGQFQTVYRNMAGM